MTVSNEARSSEPPNYTIHVTFRFTRTTFEQFSSDSSSHKRICCLTIHPIVLKQCNCFRITLPILHLWPLINYLKLNWTWTRMRLYVSLAYINTPIIVIYNYIFILIDAYLCNFNRQLGISKHIIIEIYIQINIIPALLCSLCIIPILLSIYRHIFSTTC